MATSIASCHYQLVANRNCNMLEISIKLGPLNNLGLEMLSSMFGGLGADSLAVPNRSNDG